MSGYPTGFKLYLASLTCASAALLVADAHVSASSGEIARWAVLSTLFALSEILSLNFHHERGRQSLGVGEAIVLTMLAALTYTEVVWGVTVAMAAVSILYWRLGPIKSLFNVCNFCVCAAAAAGLWGWLAEPAQTLTLRNASVGLLSIVVYSILNNIFTATAIALTERRPVSGFMATIAPAALWSLAGNVTLGLLFVAAYYSTPWMVFAFPLPVVALYLGYRAVLRQQQERERVEHLHAASRALASSPDLEHAVVGFLEAVTEIVSAVEARVVVPHQRLLVWSGIRSGEVVANLDPLLDQPMLELVRQLSREGGHVLYSEDAAQELQLEERFGARNLLAVPLVDDDEVVGCLIALDRVGAEEFGKPEAKLLESLANELVLTLDSYRLFAEVSEERERFGAIFDGSKEGICLLDEAGIIRAWNPAMARITGFEESEVRDRAWGDQIVMRDRNHQRIDGMEVISIPPEEELEIVTRQGPARWVTMLSGQVQSADEKSWVVLVRDITREHELEEAKSDFLSTVSHELRTPLTTIKGSLQVLSRPNANPDSDMGKQMVSIMKRGADRLERLVMNLLAVSQLEMGDVQVFPDEIDMSDLIAGRVEVILPDHAQVEVSIPEAVSVRADRERLAQVLEHLLDNARKFGGEEGKITVEVVKENGFAHLTVTDEGPGIAAIDQDRIFDRFVRLGHVLTRETQGPGVGLFIAKRSVEAMGGTIWVESVPDDGSTFHVRIPLARPMAVTGADATSA